MGPNTSSDLLKTQTFCFWLKQMQPNSTMVFFRKPLNRALKVHGTCGRRGPQFDLSLCRLSGDLRVAEHRASVANVDIFYAWTSHKRQHDLHFIFILTNCLLFSTYQKPYITYIYIYITNIYIYIYIYN